MKVNCSQCGKPNSKLALKCVHCGADLPRDLSESEWSEATAKDHAEAQASGNLDKRRDARADGGVMLLKGIGFALVVGALGLISHMKNLLVGQSGFSVFYVMAAAGGVYIVLGLIQLITGRHLGRGFEDLHWSLKTLVVLLIIAGVGYGLVLYWDHLMPG